MNAYEEKKKYVKGLITRLEELRQMLEDLPVCDEEDENLLDEVMRFLKNHGPRPGLAMEIGRLNWSQHGGTDAAWEELRDDEKQIYWDIGYEILASLPIYGYTVGEVIRELEADPVSRRQLEDARERVRNRRRDFVERTSGRLAELALKHHKPDQLDIWRWIDIRLTVARSLEQNFTTEEDGVCNRTLGEELTKLGYKPGDWTINLANLRQVIERVQNEDFHILQEIGYKYGCPPGIKIDVWLKFELERIRELAKRYGCPEGRDPWTWVEEQLFRMSELDEDQKYPDGRRGE